MSSTTSTPTSTVHPTLWREMTTPFFPQTLHGKGDEKAYTPKRTAKIDRQGNYLPFPNITTVCHVNLDAHPLLRTLPQKLSQLAADYLVPLPTASYHATILVGPIRNRNPEEWDSSIHSPCWQQISQYLDQVSYVPKDLVIDKVLVKHQSGGVTVYFRWGSAGRKGPESVDPTARKVEEIFKKKNMEATTNQRDNGRYQSFLSSESLLPLDGSEDGPHEHPQPKQEIHDDERRLKEIRNEMRHLAGEVVMDGRDQKMHMTIAYPRFAGGCMPDDLRSVVVDTVKSCFVKEEQRQGGYTTTGGGTSEDYHSASAVVLQPAQLYLSPDMTRFEPWDGRPCSPSSSKRQEE